MSADTAIQLIHNPHAGTGELSRDELLNILSAEGWNCSYSSVKEDNWDINPRARIVIIAGGDGTVRDVCQKIIEKRLNPVIALLPAGTSNNIAETLKINHNIRSAIRSWKHGNGASIHFDNGQMNNQSFNSFFIESAGVGLFPEMVKNIDNKKLKENRSAAEKQKDSLKALYETSLTYTPQFCYLQIDGKDYSADYILIEIMNISFVGPNILLNPYAVINDGFLDIVISRADDKEKTIAYIRDKLSTGKDECPLPVIRGKHIQLKWSGEEFHVDDKLVQVDRNSLTEITSRQHSFTLFQDTPRSKGK